MEIASKLCTYTDCGKEGTKTCGRCKSVKYCSVNCQTKHYPEHRESCLKIIADKEKIGMPVNDKHGYAVVVTQQDYSRMVNTIKKGEKFYISDKHGKEVEVIKRGDGNYYEKDSGKLIINIAQNTHLELCSNWAKLCDKYGRVTVVGTTLAVFVDKKEKKFIVLDTVTDTIVYEKVDPRVVDPDTEFKVVIKDGVECVILSS